MESAFEDEKAKSTRKSKLSASQKEKAQEFVDDKRLNELKEEIN